MFPLSAQRWKSYASELADEGLADTTHYGEVDPYTMEAIFTLLNDTAAALKNRGTPEYDSLLNKIPVHWRNKLNYILQYGAEFAAQMFGVRRGQENMRDLKKADFQILEDHIKDFKYIKQISSEKDKNHKLGTHASLNGCIPYVQFAKWNPGEYFEQYLSYLPEEGTGLLFPKSRQPSNTFSLHDPETMVLYSSKMPGKGELLGIIALVLDWMLDLYLSVKGFSVGLFLYKNSLQLVAIPGRVPCSVGLELFHVSF